MRQHNLDAKAEHTLAEKDVADGLVNVDAGGLTSMDHEPVRKLHRLGALGTEFARHDNLATLSTALHHVTQDTIASTTHSQTTKQLVAKALALSNGAQTTGGNLLSEELIKGKDEEETGIRAKILEGKKRETRQRGELKAFSFSLFTEKSMHHKSSTT